MKKINFTEYTYVLNEYQGEVTISNSDYKKLKNGQIDMKYIMINYELDYDGSSEPYYDETIFDSIEWEVE